MHEFKQSFLDTVMSGNDIKLTLLFFGGLILVSISTLLLVKTKL